MKPVRQADRRGRRRTLGRGGGTPGRGGGLDVVLGNLSLVNPGLVQLRAEVGDTQQGTGHSGSGVVVPAEDNEGDEEEMEVPVEGEVGGDDRAWQWEALPNSQIEAAQPIAIPPSQGVGGAGGGEVGAAHHNNNICWEILTQTQHVHKIMAENGDIWRYRYFAIIIAHLCPAVEKFTNSLREICLLQWERSKTEVFLWEGPLPERTSEGLKMAGCEVEGICERGFLCYGVPIGSDRYVRQVLEGKSGRDCRGG